jgi:hypothetical protein
MLIAISIILFVSVVSSAVTDISFPYNLLHDFHESCKTITSLESEVKLLVDELRILNCRVAILEFMENNGRSQNLVSLSEIPEGCSLTEAMEFLSLAKLRLGESEGLGSRDLSEWNSQLKLKEPETSSKLEALRNRLHLQHACVQTLASQLTDTLQHFAQEKRIELHNIERRLQNMFEFRQELIWRGRILRSLIDSSFQVVPENGTADEFALRASWSLMEEGQNIFESIQTSRIISNEALDGILLIPGFLTNLVDTELDLATESFARISEEIAEAEKGLSDVTQFFL